MFFSSDQSDLDTTPSRTRTRSSSRASDFTATDDDPIQESSSLSTFTSFDAYFAHASRPSRTSSNVFSHLVQPLSTDEYATSLARTFYPLPFSSAPARLLDETRHAHMPRYLLELAAGFNLLFYGLGSKRAALNELARACAQMARAHVVVIDGVWRGGGGGQGMLSASDIGAALARLPGAPQDVQGVSEFLSSPIPPSSSSSSSSSSLLKGGRQRRRLVLIVHNADAPALRAAGKARTMLGALAALEGVQVAASVDHINAPLLWTSTEMLARRWLWHDLTTLAPYDVELAGSDPASLRAVSSSARAGTTTTAAAAEGGGLGGGQVGMMTETAARHVLVAVTQRARKLFALMGRRQLDALADAGDVDPTTPAQAAEVAAITYDMLFNLARDHFIATNDTALRALLGEFRDHGLVVTVGTGAMGSGEMLWIPLRKERLTKLLDGLQEDVNSQTIV